MKHINSLLKKVGKGQGGFTLIELLIVIVILGIIAAVVALNIGGFLGTGQLQAANTEASNVKTAVMAYMADHGLFTLDETTFGGASESTIIDPYLEGGTSILKAVYTVAVTTPAEGDSTCIIKEADSAGIDGGWDMSQIEWCIAKCSWVKAGECEGSEGTST